MKSLSTLHRESRQKKLAQKIMLVLIIFYLTLEERKILNMFLQKEG